MKRSCLAKQNESAVGGKIFSETPTARHQTGTELKKRVLSIDLIRGFLMLLIIIGHGLILLDDAPGSRWVKEVATRIVNLGTPAFTLVSGMLLGYFEVTRRDFGAIRRQYFKRGVQLLTVAHLFIAVALFPSRKGISFIESYWSFLYITDTLGLLFMSVPCFIARLSPPSRLAVGSLFLISWKALDLLLPAASNAGLILKELLFGVDPAGPNLLRNTYPLIPLLALFLIGTVIGNRFAFFRVKERTSDFVDALRRGVAPLSALSAMLVALWGIGKFRLFGVEGTFLKALFYPDKLYSLLPFYMALFFLLAVFYVTRLEIRGQSGPFDRLFLLFGRTSLFTYVSHYFVVQTVPYLIGWDGALTLPQTLLFLVIAVGLVSAISALYQTYFLTKKRALTPAAVAADAEPAGS